MSSGLLIGLGILGVGLLMVGVGYYQAKTANERYNALSCKGSVFIEAECDNESQSMGIGIGVFLVGGIFTLVGMTTSVIFGIKLAIDTRKRVKK